jgi:hypothetical protein
MAVFQQPDKLRMGQVLRDPEGKPQLADCFRPTDEKIGLRKVLALVLTKAGTILEDGGAHFDAASGGRTCGSEALLKKGLACALTLGPLRGNINLCKATARPRYTFNGCLT